MNLLSKPPIYPFDSVELKTLIKQAEEPERNLLDMTDVNSIADNEAVFNTLYLLEAFILSAHFKQPPTINHQIALVRHRKLMTNSQL